MSIKTSAVEKANEPALGTPGRLKIGAQQITDTIVFEFIRNKKKTLILLVVNTLLFLLFYTLQQVSENRGQPLPEDPASYAQSYMSMIDLIIIINSVSFGGYVISQDFAEKTGHILFPKISKARLLAGRTIGVYLLNAFCIAVYYIEVIIVTASKYGGDVPVTLLQSMGWALLYAFGTVTFVIFWSSMLRSSAIAVIISLLFLWMVFSIIEGIMSITTTMEPVFLLTYYGKIITAVFNWPEQRYIEQSIPVQQGQVFTIRQWLTPTPTEAVVGIVVYTVVFLVLAYYRFKTRQFKN